MKDLTKIEVQILQSMKRRKTPIWLNLKAAVIVYDNIPPIIKFLLYPIVTRYAFKKGNQIEKRLVDLGYVEIDDPAFNTYKLSQKFFQSLHCNSIK